MSHLNLDSKCPVAKTCRILTWAKTVLMNGNVRNMWDSLFARPERNSRQLKSNRFQFSWQSSILLSPMPIYRTSNLPESSPFKLVWHARTLRRTSKLQKLSTPTIYANIPKGFQSGRAVTVARSGYSEVARGRGFESHCCTEVILKLAWGPNNLSPERYVEIWVCEQEITLKLAWGPSNFSPRNPARFFVFTSACLDFSDLLFFLHSIS